MKEQVLAALRGENGAYLSGRALSEALGVTRAAVWKDVRRLQAEGYEIESDPKRGYRLVGGRILLTREELLPGPATAVLGQKVVHFDTVDSTNLQARRLAERGEPEGTAVTAEEQTQGKGRAGRAWLSSAGKGIWLSLLLRPGTPMSSLPCLTMAACAAVGTAIAHVTGEVQVKWPNDVLLGGRKVGGILAECSGETDRIAYAVLGIGLDVNQDAADFSPFSHNRAVSLKMACGRRQSRQNLLCGILEALEPLYRIYKRTGRCEEALAFCRAHSCVLGRRVLLRQGQSETHAQAVDLTPNGGLRVRCDDGSEHTVAFGEVSLRLPAKP